MKVLVAGWFSFELMGASAGDLLVRDLACEWLEEADRDYDVAVAPPFEDGVDWRAVDPLRYSDLVFVCGPIGNGAPVTDLLERFAHARIVGLNLTMLHRLEDWNPFHLLWERDSSRTARPDLAILAPVPRTPVVGVVLIDAQPEYGDLDLHARVDRAIARLLETRDAARVSIDTRLDLENASGLRTPGEVEALVARMDVVVTTRLHGLVLALKNGVPALAIDTVAGGAKVTRQAEALGWTTVLAAESLDERTLAEAFSECLTEEARSRARAVAPRAAAALAVVREQFVAAFGG